MTARADNSSSVPEAREGPQEQAGCGLSHGDGSGRRCAARPDPSDPPFGGLPLGFPLFSGTSRRGYLFVLRPSPPCSWRWKITYTMSTGRIVIVTEANIAPQSDS